MTAAEWDGCNDPAMMLEGVRGKASDRKLRLYAAACCRRVWHLMPDERCRAAVGTAERFADGSAGQRRRGAAFAAAMAVGASEPPRRETIDSAIASRAAWAARDCAARRIAILVPSIGTFAGYAAAIEAERAAGGGAADTPELRRVWQAAHDAERRAQCQLLRCVFGRPPFGPAPAAPAWLAWNGGAAVKLARAAYEGRQLPSGTLDAARLAVLADMLEEAGCTDARLLGHLRGPGPHVRGCWPLDLLLGRS